MDKYIAQKIIDLKDGLKKQNKKGIVLDIDETLSATALYYMEGLQETFGNSENLTTKQLIEKYRYTHEVPDWKTEEANVWLEEARTSNELHENLSTIPGSEAAIEHIHEIIPIVGYLTARPEKVLESTQKWLSNHNFPDASVILRPDALPHSNGNEWKAAVLEFLYPEVEGIIDDNPALTTYLSGEYKGSVYLYNTNTKLRSDIRIYPSLTWDDVIKNVRKHYE